MRRNDSALLHESNHSKGKEFIYEDRFFHISDD